MEQATSFAPVTWRLRSRTLSTHDHTLIMGVLNVTPDSFSDGGQFITDAGAADLEAAIGHGFALWESGADLVDVGGESTRPGSHGVDEATELARILPVVRELAASGMVISVDTSKPGVAEAAIEAGAEVINDVTALGDPAMSRLCADAEVGVVLMHMKGRPETMQDDPQYDDVVADVRDFLVAAAEEAGAGGVSSERVCLDPGIGFGKTHHHNLQLLAHLDTLVAAGFPVMVGASRKGLLGKILEHAGHPTPAPGRDPATGATIALAVAKGAAVVRVHDVPSALQAARTADAIVRAGFTDPGAQSSSRSAEPPARTAIGIGSNLGDRRRHIDEAIIGLADLGSIVAVSSVYESAPIGGPDQGDYLNAVAVIDTELAPERVLELLLEIERGRGRQRRERWGPRTLDLDVLLYDDLVVDQPGLTIPHPRMTERRFVLEPLIEVWPDASLPDGTKIADLLPQLAEQDLRLVIG